MKVGKCKSTFCNWPSGVGDMEGVRLLCLLPLLCPLFAAALCLLLLRYCGRSKYATHVPSTLMFIAMPAAAVMSTAPVVPAATTLRLQSYISYLRAHYSYVPAAAVAVPAATAMPAAAAVLPAAPVVPAAIT